MIFLPFFPAPSLVLLSPHDYKRGGLPLPHHQFTHLFIHSSIDQSQVHTQSLAHGMLLGDAVDLGTGIAGLFLLGWYRRQRRKTVGALYMLRRYRNFFPALIYSALFSSRVLAFFFCREVRPPRHWWRIALLILLGGIDNWWREQLDFPVDPTWEFGALCLLWSLVNQGEKERAKVFLAVLAGWPLSMSAFFPVEPLCLCYAVPTYILPEIIGWKTECLELHAENTVGDISTATESDFLHRLYEAVVYYHVQLSRQFWANVPPDHGGASSLSDLVYLALFSWDTLTNPGHFL